MYHRECGPAKKFRIDVWRCSSVLPMCMLQRTNGESWTRRLAHAYSWIWRWCVRLPTMEPRGQEGDPEPRHSLTGIRFFHLSSATTEASDQAQKQQWWGEMYLTRNINERVHWMLTWKTPKLGKTTGALRLQNITMWGLQQWGTEATTSCSLASPPSSYNRGNDLFLSLTRSVHSYTLNYLSHT